MKSFSIEKKIKKYFHVAKFNGEIGVYTSILCGVYMKNILNNKTVPTVILIKFNSLKGDKRELHKPNRNRAERCSDVQH